MMKISQSELNNLQKCIINDQVNDIQKFIESNGVAEISSLSFGKFGADFFNFACANAASKIVSFVLHDITTKNVELYNTDKLGYNALHNVCDYSYGNKEKRDEIILDLLKYGFNPNEKVDNPNKNGEFLTPMSLFCTTRFQDPIISFAINPGDTEILLAMFEAGAERGFIGECIYGQFAKSKSIDELQIVLFRLFTLVADVDFVKHADPIILRTLFHESFTAKRIRSTEFQQLCCKMLLLVISTGFELENLVGEDGIAIIMSYIEGGDDNCIINCIKKLKDGKSALEVAKEMNFEDIKEHIETLPDNKEKLLKKIEEFQKGVNERLSARACELISQKMKEFEANIESFNRDLKRDLFGRFEQMKDSRKNLISFEGDLSPFIDSVFEDAYHYSVCVGVLSEKVKELQADVKAFGKELLTTFTDLIMFNGKEKFQLTSFKKELFATLTNSMLQKEKKLQTYMRLFGEGLVKGTTKSITEELESPYPELLHPIKKSQEESRKTDTPLSQEERKGSDGCETFSTPQQSGPTIPVNSSTEKTVPSDQNCSFKPELNKSENGDVVSGGDRAQKGISMHAQNGINKSSNIKPNTAKKMSNARKAMAAVLTVAFLATFVSAVVLFAVKYTITQVPIILICVAIAIIPLIMLSFPVISGCFLPNDEKLHDDIDSPENLLSIDLEQQSMDKENVII